MKKLLLSSAALMFLSAGSAIAADMPVKGPVYKAAAPFSWEGLYAGVHAGYGWGDYELVDGFFSQTASLKPKSFLGGFQLGYNSYIAPNWVLGSEMDFSFGDLKDNTSTVATGGFPGGFPASGKIDFFGTARARLGYAIDHTLIYLTGGGAWAHTKGTEIFGIAPVANFNPNTYHMGWTVGGGLEYALDQHWSAKIEYLYADLGHTTHEGGGAGLIRSADLTMNTVKAGLNYRFGDPAPSASTLPVKARPAAWSWDGSYIGAYGGYGWGSFKALDDVFASGAIKLDPAGAFGGIVTGYNWQFSRNWLFGIETDNSFGGMKDSGLSAGPAVFLVNVKTDDFGTMRARLGYVTDRTLVYATGGLAWAHIKFDEVIGGGGPTMWHMNTYQIGWTAGAGIEYAIDSKWSAKVEYLYADYGRGTDIFLNAGRSWSLTQSTIKAGVNYKFDLADFIRGR